MLDLPMVLLFVGSALVLLVIPGPAVIYIITQSIDQGRAAGLVSALGISVGTFIHVIAAALGLSAILVSSATAFTIVKYIGAIYLIYLGIRELVMRSESKQQRYKQTMKLRSIFIEGAFVNLLNPKLALFMFSFLPQFVKVSNGSVGPQIITLGIILIITGLISDTIYALLSASVRSWLKKHPDMMKIQKRFTGTVYVALGMLTAFHGNQK